jgi:hypothetical protein
MSEEADSTDPAVESALRALTRGALQGNLKDRYIGHRSLCKIGRPAISRIRDALQQTSWSKIKYSNQIRHLAALISVLRDIDETEAGKMANKIKQGGCDPAVTSILDSICSFTVEDYFQYEAAGIRVFEHKQLAVKQPVRPRLEKWLRNVPKEDLAEIERIYIVRRGDVDALGTYTPFLCNINLVWDNPYSRFDPVSFFDLFNIESILYHEIGHHINRHTFGQDEDQEKEADDYSDYLMRRSSHLIFRILRALFDVPPRPARKRNTGG